MNEGDLWRWRCLDLDQPKLVATCTLHLQDAATAGSQGESTQISPILSFACGPTDNKV